MRGRPRSADLLSLRKRVTQSGISIELPRTADGRHADYAPSIALAVEKRSDEPDSVLVRPAYGSAEWATSEAAKLEAAHTASVQREQARAWWDDGASDHTGDPFGME